MSRCLGAAAWIAACLLLAAAWTAYLSGAGDLAGMLATTALAVAIVSLGLQAHRWAQRLLAVLRLTLTARR